MSMAFEFYFKSLAGSWSLERKISTGETFNGKAVFEPISGTAFLMREEGILVLNNGANVPASKYWYWHIADNAILEISYDEEKDQPYHHVNLSGDKSGWSGSAEHLCGADLYSGSYRFSKDRFMINQTIKGPNKDYSLITSYESDHSK